MVLIISFLNLSIHPDESETAKRVRKVSNHVKIRPVLILLKASFAFCQDNVISLTQNQTMVIVKVNEPFILKVEGCPSCGFQWILEPGDTTKMKLI